MALADNLARVRSRIAAALARSGRDPAGVTLVAVAKTASLETVKTLAALGVADFGENRAQEGVPKAAALPEARWHFIGRLQRNKVRKVLEHFSLIHSVDSLPLAEQIARVGAETGWAGEVLVEVNMAGEAQKGGVPAAEAEAFFRGLAFFRELRVSGLMAMAPLDPDPEKARPVFRGLRELRDRLRDATGLPLPQLSMGMSQDFEVAVEEGATMVRVGTALFRTGKS